MKRLVLILIGAHVAALLIVKGVDWAWSSCFGCECPDKGLEPVVETILEEVL